MMKSTVYFSETKLKCAHLPSIYSSIRILLQFLRYCLMLLLATNAVGLAYAQVCANEWAL